MKGKKILLYLVVIIIFFSLYRLIPIPYPHGIDSFYILERANAINKLAFMPWNFDVFATIGMHPLGYPIAAILFLSLASCLVGVQPYLLIKVIPILILISTTLLSYLLIRRITQNVLLFTNYLIFVNLGLYYIIFSNWDFTSRLFLLPLFISLLLLINLRYENAISLTKFSILLTLVLLLIALTHRAIFMILLVTVIPIFVTQILLLYKQKKQKLVHNLQIYSYSIFFVILFILPLFNINILAKLGLEFKFWEFFFTNSFSSFVYHLGFFSNIAAFVIDCLRYTNLLILFFPLGFLCLLLKKKKNKFEEYLLVSLFFSAPFFFDREYFLFIYSPFLGLMCMYGLIYMEQINLKIMYKNVLFLLLIYLSIGFGSFLTYRNFRPNPNIFQLDDWMGSRTYQVGSFIKSNSKSNEVTIFNEHADSWRIKGVFDINTLRDIDVLQNLYFVDNLHCKNIFPANFREGFRQCNNPFELISREHYDYPVLYEYLFFVTPDNRNILINTFNIRYLVLNKEVGMRYQIFFNFQRDDKILIGYYAFVPMYKLNVKEYDVIYENGLHILYRLN